MRDRVKPGTPNDEVLEIIREEAHGAIDNAFSIIRTRIDQFGVSQPNIQYLDTKDRILVDLPGVNAQEKTKSELIKSLRIGAQEMLASEINFEPEAYMTTISVPDPEWLCTIERTE